jgi:sugar O-acyltransferase (sialic acid O-acetyltransferase NeuD family)
MKRLAILGASGHGKVVAEIAELCGWEKIHFYDDAWPDVAQNGLWSVVGKTNDLIDKIREYDNAIVAIGDNDIRYEKSLFLISKGFKLATLIHPAAIVSQYSNISQGSVVMAGVVINPFVEFGEACIVNTSATIDHDCVIDNAVHISPGVNLAGAVKVGALSWIGIGASVKQCIQIGTNVVIGAGATVINDVYDDFIVVGTPAKPK